MAPILKEADAPATTATTTATTPVSPVSKSPNETPTRSQPVALEIPVTVNGARTVEGSDKREPFAETTQTVLVFPHGAVIRIATTLAPGQLIFLTNEKTKKEVVCQVVKSRSGGSASGYVELLFTEPAPAFWGLRLPGTVAVPPATAPAVPRPASPSPVAPKVVSPAPPATKIPVPAPVAPPAAQAPAAPQLAVAPPVPLAKAAPPAPKPVVPSLTAAPVSVAPPPSAPKLPEPAPLQSAPVNTTPTAPLVSVPPPHPLTSDRVSPTIHKVPNPLIPSPAEPPRDYSKEIESLFAVPQAPVFAPPKTAPVAPPAPAPRAASSPSSEVLKLQAARLQEQLSSMLFTDAPATARKSSVPPAEVKPETPVAHVASKIIEITHQEPTPAAEPDTKVDLKPESKVKPEIKLDPKPASSPRTPVFSSLNAKDEEVAIPAWLHPLSQHAEIFQEPAPAVESSEVSSSEPVTADTTDSEISESSPRSEAAVFGGQLLSGEASAETTPAAGSKKGLFLGLAAAAALLAGAGAWYYLQAHPSVAKPQTTPSSAGPLTAGPVATATSSPSPAAASRPAANSPAASTPANSTPVRNSPPPPVTPSPAPAESRNSTAARNSAAAPEPPKKPALGEIRLATPVVKESGESGASTESLPSIDSTVDTSSADALAASAHRKGPTAPLPIGGDVKPAQLIKSVSPVYPQMAKTQRITGNVTLDALVDTSGNVAELKVLSGPAILHRAALDAVKQWKYTPAQLDGTPTAIHLTVTVQFRAQ
jgi:periplasmic protein TonB